GVIIEIARDPGEFERAFHHAQRRVAVAIHDPIRERTVIRPDAHRAPELPAKFYQRREALADPLQLGGVLFVGVFEDLELFRVGVIAWVDPDFLYPLRRFHRGFRFEMNVGDDRHLAAALAQAAYDLLQIRRVLYRRRRDSHDLAADFRQLDRLRDRRRRVHRVASDHRLDANRIGATNSDAADHHFAGDAAAVPVWTLAVIHRSEERRVG